MSQSPFDSPKPDIDFMKVFHGPCNFRWREFECSVKCEKHHAIVLPTGSIMVGDPAWFESHPEPMAHVVPPGRYSIDVALRVALKIGKPDEGAYEDLAMVRISFSEKPVVKWVPVTTWGVRVGMTEPGLLVGGLPVLSRYDVLCFLDASLVKQQSKSSTSLEDLVGDFVSANGTYNQIVVDPKTGANIVQVPSGLCSCLNYPGRSGIFWGLDSKEDAACLITDFGAFSQSIKETKTIGSIGQLIKDKTLTIATSSGSYRINVLRGAGVTIEVRGPDLHDIECNVTLRGKLVTRPGTGYGWGGKEKTKHGIRFHSDAFATTEYGKLPDEAVLTFTHTDRIEPLI